MSNIKTDRPEAIINGNERVLKARLSDAQFFFTLDRQNRLENNLDTLKKVIYHNRLGNIFERTQRLVFLTKKFGIILGLDEKLCERSALLSKADLVSKMVGEFPELQGVMGKYYSQFDCENSEVSISIEEHYLPRFSGDQIPNTMLGNCLSLADKIESIVGLWSVGVTPTGEKDPMGLRRNAIGIIRIIMENKVNINLDDIINYASQSLKYNLTLDDNFSKLKSFFLERLSNLLKERKFPIANIDAVLMNFDGKLFEISNKLDAISHFLSIPESRGLCATNKRINNILRKATKNIDPEMLDPNLFQEKSEFILFNQLTVVATSTSKLISDKKFKETLLELCKLKSPVDNFFNDVLVNTTNEKLRINRLCLLMTLNKTMNEVAELSLLVE